MCEKKPSNQKTPQQSCWDQEMLHTLHPGLALDRDGQNQGGLLALVSCTSSKSREALFIGTDPLWRRGGGQGGGSWRTSWCLLLHFRQVWIICKRVNEEFPAFVPAAKSFSSVWMCKIAGRNCTKSNLINVEIVFLDFQPAPNDNFSRKQSCVRVVIIPPSGSQSQAAAIFLLQTQQVGWAGEVSRWKDMWFRSRRPGLVRSQRPLLADCSKNNQCVFGRIYICDIKENIPCSVKAAVCFTEMLNGPSNVSSCSLLCFSCRWRRHLWVDVCSSPPGLWPGPTGAWNSSTPTKRGAGSWWWRQTCVPVVWQQVPLGVSRTGHPGMRLCSPAGGATRIWRPLLAGMSVRLQRRWFIATLMSCDASKALTPKLSGSNSEEEAAGGGGGGGGSGRWRHRGANVRVCVCVCLKTRV